MIKNARAINISVSKTVPQSNTLNSRFTHTPHINSVTIIRALTNGSESVRNIKGR